MVRISVSNISKMKKKNLNNGVDIMLKTYN